MSLELEIYPDKIRHNTQLIAHLLAPTGASFIGVTKACCGAPEVGAAMLAGGAAGLGDSRLANIQRLRRAGLETTFFLLRSTLPSQIDETIEYVDISLETHPRVIEALARRAHALGKVHQIILMVDVGDFREGLWPAEVPVVVERIKDLPGINLVGLGTNLACFEGVLPNENNMALLLDLVHFIREHHHLELPIISGGNSSSLPTIMAGNWFPEVNHLRMGESILLGKDIVYDTPLPGAYLDAFILQGEIIEIHAKAPGPSLPEGEVRLRAVLALGVQDIGAGKLQPLLPGTEYLGATSDHCLVDITHCPQSLQVGDQIPFLPDYKGLLGAMTSPYVGKVIKNWSLNQLSP